MVYGLEQSDENDERCFLGGEYFCEFAILILCWTTNDIFPTRLKMDADNENTLSVHFTIKIGQLVDHVTDGRNMD